MILEEFARKPIVLPNDFWEKPDFKDYNPANFRDKDAPGFRLETPISRFMVASRRDDSTESPRYHTIIYDEAIAESVGCMQSPLDLPGYIISSRTTSKFEDCLKNHFGAMNRLSNLGY